MEFQLLLYYTHGHISFEETLLIINNRYVYCVMVKYVLYNVYTFLLRMFKLQSIFYDKRL